MHYRRKLAPYPVFFRRLGRNAVVGFALMGVALFIGMAGYHFIEHLTWIDSYANAAMILSGMGPLAEMKSTAGKMFAGSYALFSGLAFITVTGIILAPVAHRFLHRFHLESEEEETKQEQLDELRKKQGQPRA